jgi:hypothetical protein
MDCEWDVLWQGFCENTACHDAKNYLVAHAHRFACSDITVTDWGGGGWLGRVEFGSVLEAVRVCATLKVTAICMS